MNMLKDNSCTSKKKHGGAMNLKNLDWWKQYMELIYLYVEKFENIVKKQEINFSPNFNVKIKDKKLTERAYQPTS